MGFHVKLVDQLEAEWEDDGFLGRLRAGEFSPDNAVRFLETIRGMEIPNGTMVPKRLLSLMWYIPIFLDWQRERVQEHGGDMNAYRRFLTEVQNALEKALGVP